MVDKNLRHSDCQISFRLRREISARAKKWHFHILVSPSITLCDPIQDRYTTYIRRSLQEHRQQLHDDDMEVVVCRLSADIQHARTKHPDIVKALCTELARVK
jgi:hypothetical protein